MSGNHARDNDYQPGQLLPDGEVTLDGADASYSTLNTPYTIRNAAATLLYFDYTPPVDCRMYLTLQFTAATDTPDRQIFLCIYEELVVVGFVSMGVMYFPGISSAQTLTIAKRMALTGGVAYRFYGQIYLPLGSPQTVTMVASGLFTKLIYQPLVHP
jgi:hypothetical protein